MQCVFRQAGWWRCCVRRDAGRALSLTAAGGVFTLCRSAATGASPLVTHCTASFTGHGVTPLLWSACCGRRFCSHSAPPPPSPSPSGPADTPPAISQRARLRLAARDYGATVLVFHVSLALCSLAVCYTAVSCGVDMAACLGWLGVSQARIQASPALLGGSAFVVAYAVHKLGAPLRIGVTLACAPLIVRRFRRTGWLKAAKSQAGDKR